MPIGEGTSKARARASIEPVIIILHEFPTTIVDPIDLLLLRMYLHRLRWFVLGIPFV